MLTTLDRLENAAWLDPAVDELRKIVNAVVRSRSLRDVLHGVPLGHPVHPLAVQLPLGAWISAGVLDTIPGTERAARILVGLGIAGALPAAAAGYTDWAELHEQQQRVGIVHSSGNLVATSLFVASFIQRGRGRQGSGKALGFAGLAVAGVAGYLGGHLSYRQASGANHAEDIPHRVQPGWQPLDRLENLSEGRLDQRMLGEIPLLVFRRGDEVSVLSDVCSHLSGPLHEGEITEQGDPCVVCPWHGSVFSLRSGDVVHGPATAPQPSFETRVRDGLVEINLPGAG
ncbi:hypothetical protein GCM10009841_26530 [Microlunatus panaciterrae]